ncbi:MAG: Hsp20/alpha crystallin family protein [Bdellovibrionaceae bacterium]|nr:Hsp20/alpha crystallin family protein [Pseudobdellovibrionaceae bacterium]
MMVPYVTRRALASDLFTQMNREFDRLFEDFVPAQREAWENREALANAHTHEDEKFFLVSVDMPGMKREDIKIEVLDHILTVTGERKERSPARQYILKRSFSLPREVNAESVEANYEDGVLKLYLPKVEAPQARQIEVKAGQTGVWEQLAATPQAQTKAPTEGSQH